MSKVLKQFEEAVFKGGLYKKLFQNKPLASALRLRKPKTMTPNSTTPGRGRVPERCEECILAGQFASKERFACQI
jgi:hypothetical protein